MLFHPSHNALALLSLLGLTLDSLGGLFLAYDLLGGEHGPIRVIGRVFVYGLIFEIGYVLFLGPVPGSVIGMGLATALAIEFSRAARKIVPRKRTEIAFAISRGLVMGTAGACVGGIAYGASLGALGALFLTWVYLLSGASGSKSYNQDLEGRITFRQFIPSFWRGLAIALAAGLTSVIVGENFPHGFIPYWLWLGLTVTTVSCCISLSTSWVERLFTKLKDRQLGMIGTLMFLTGFALQSVQYWLVFIPEVPR